MQMHRALERPLSILILPKRGRYSLGLGTVTAKQCVCVKVLQKGLKMEESCRSQIKSHQKTHEDFFWQGTILYKALRHIKQLSLAA